jgi:predicted MFS family arabinose efflux permease
VFALSVACFAVLVPYELKRRDPLIEVRFFASAPFSGATAIAVCVFAGIAGFLFLNTLYLQDVRGLSPLHAGLYMLPMAAVMLVFAPISGRVVGRWGARPPMLAAGVALIAAAIMLTRITPDTPVAYLFTAYFLFGLGSALVNPPITNTAISGMPPSQAGVAAGIASTSRQVGSTLGVAVLGAVAGGAASGSLGRNFAAHTHPAWVIVAVLGVLVLILGALTTSRWALGTARRTAERFSDTPPRAARATYSYGSG